MATVQGLACAQHLEVHAVVAWVVGLCAPQFICLHLGGHLGGVPSSLVRDILAQIFMWMCVIISLE